MADHYFIGIEIGGTKIQLALADATLSLCDHICVEVNKDQGARGIKKQVEEGINNLLKGRALKSIGVGFGGPVNYETGIINTSHQIAGWQDFNLKQWLEKQHGVPVFVDNDANVAALGEALQGGGQAYKNVFYMTIGSGIGGGLVINKKIYHGALPGEIEVGHIRLNKEGLTLESAASGWAVDAAIRSATRNDTGGLLAELTKDISKGEARILSKALESKDHTSEKIIVEAADNIAFALSHVIHLIHPEIIIIGGGLSLLGDHLISPIMTALPGYLLKSFLPAPVVKTAMLKELVVPLGALQLAKTSLEPLMT